MLLIHIIATDANPDPLMLVADLDTDEPLWESTACRAAWDAVLDDAAYCEVFKIRFIDARRTTRSVN